MMGAAVLGIETAEKPDSWVDTANDRQRELQMKELECLIFSFKNILRIDNLRGFEALTKLQLDNNAISKIENLDHLTNLTWLDLSFNNIAKIEGLTALTKITDLSLFNNRIEVIEGLDTLSNLNVVSLGNNHMKNLENVMYLRRFKKLRLVNLEGNPFCKDPDYKGYVLAHIKDLSYLDYRLVDPAAVVTAREQYQDEMLEVEEREEAQEAKEKAAAEKAAEAALHQEANLAGIDSLFETMLAEDPEYGKLRQVPGLLDALGEYRDKFTAAVEEFKENAIEQYRRKKEEMRLWRAAVDKVLHEKDNAARALVVAFEKPKKKVFREVRADPVTAEEKLRGPQEENELLLDRLMDLEMQTVDILSDLWTEFDTNYSSIMDINKQIYSSFFSVVRGLENKFFESVSVVAMALFEKFAVGEMEDLESDDARLLLGEKDTLLNAIQASHDAHTTKMDSMEDQKAQREIALYNALQADNKKWETQRNRERITEIWNIIDRNRLEMDAMLSEDDEHH